MSPRAVLVAALIALCTAALLPQEYPELGRSPLLWKDHAQQVRQVRQLEENQQVSGPGKRRAKGKKSRSGTTKEKGDGESRDGKGRDGTSVEGDEGSDDASSDGRKKGSATDGEIPPTEGEEKSDGGKEQPMTGSAENGSAEAGGVEAGDELSDAPGDKPGNANDGGDDDTKKAETDTTKETGVADTKPPKTDDGSNADKGTETASDENEPKGRDTPRETSGNTTDPRTESPPRPQKTTPDSEDRPDEPEIPVDAPPGFSTDLPVSLIGGGVVAGLFCILAVGLYCRRSNEPVYTPVQREDFDADGWNDGWDDGWGEGAGNDDVAAKA